MNLQRGKNEGRSFGAAVTEVEVQREYYARTAHGYNAKHCHEGDEHYFALDIMLSVLDRFEIHSVLDLGSGTGRALMYLRKFRTDLKVVGVEPSSDMRTAGYESGVPKDVLVAGDATALQYGHNSFDLVCAFGMLHHIRQPAIAIGEALRVARKAIFISDSNNFGQGSSLVRAAKQTLNALGLWPLANWTKTKGKGYNISEGDGLAYSYSLFSNMGQIRRGCSRVYLFGTADSGPNLYRSARCVAVLALKGFPDRSHNSK